MSDEILSRLDSIQTGIEEREAAQQQQLDQLNAKVEELSAAGADEQVEQIERVAGDMDARALTLNLDQKDINKFSMTRAIRGFIVERNPEKYCPFELDLHRELMRAQQANIEHRVSNGGRNMGSDEFIRTMTSLQDSEGGFLVAEEIAAQFYNNYRPRTVLGRLGVTQVRPRGVPFRLNKKTGNTTAYRRGETSSITASDVAFGQLNLSPKSIAARTVLSLENVMWTDPAVDRIVEDDLMETLTLRQDRDALVGTGASNQPIGIINTSGVTNLNAGSGSGTPPTYENVGIQMELTIANGDALVDDGTLKYCGHPGHVAALRQEKHTVTTSGERTYIIPPYGKATAGDFLSYPFETTTQLNGFGADADSAPVFFGRWSDYIHAMWGGLLVKRSDVATDGTNNALTEGWVHLVVVGWDDGGVIRNGAFCYDDTMDKVLA